MKKLEITVALLITVAAVWLHVARFSAAGALWRDEVSAVNLATAPSLTDIAKQLHHEAFPLLFSLIVRGYVAVAGSGDAALRVFGLLVGLSLIAVLWLTAQLLNGRPPTVGVALVGISAAVVQWADWLRGHGLGMVFMLLTFGLIWKVATAPTRKVVILTTLSAAASVHTLYYNAVLLFAAGLAGAVVAAAAAGWRRALLVLGICGLAAVSMLPYLAVVRRAADLGAMYEVQFSLERYWGNLSSALAAAAGVQWVWVGLGIAAVSVAVIWQLRGGGPRQHVSSYCALALVLSVPSYFLFLKILKYPTQPWYYVPLLGFGAAAIDGAFNTLRDKWSTAARAAVALAVAGWSFLSVHEAIQVRQTNLDIVAAKLKELAAPEDVVVVMPWYLGVTFDRYYDGAAASLTVPPISDRELQRYDLFKQQMQTAEPLAPVFSALETALRSGGRVWLVGELLLPESGEAPAAVSPAPDSHVGWSEGAYMTSWMLQTMHFLQQHVWSAEEVNIDVTAPINPHENARVLVVRGWR